MQIERRLLLAAAVAAWPAAAVAQQRLAPIALPASDGQPVLPESGGTARATYLDFWASWCVPCRLSFPWMNRMHERHAASGLRIVAINLDAREADARRFLAEHPARFAVALDPAAETARQLAIQAMPTSLIVSADRRVLRLHRGFRADDAAALEAALRAALV